MTGARCPPLRLQRGAVGLAVAHTQRHKQLLGVSGSGPQQQWQQQQVAVVQVPRQHPEVCCQCLKAAPPGRTLKPVMVGACRNMQTFS